MPTSYWEHGSTDRRGAFWAYALAAIVLVVGAAVYFLTQGRVVQREVTEEISFVDVLEPEPEPEREQDAETPEADIPEVPDVEIPDLPSTRIDPIQDAADQREQAQNPLSLVGEGEDGTDAFQLGSASRNRGLLRGAAPGTNAEARYWGLVQTEIRSHLFGYADIDRVEWQCVLTVVVNDDASIEFSDIAEVEPASLRDELAAALKELKFVSLPPPSGSMVLLSPPPCVRVSAVP